MTGLAVLTAVDDGLIDLDEPAPPPAPDGATIRHLLAHASGLAFDGTMIQGRPGTRRIYSNTGFDILGALLADRDGIHVDAALRRRVLDPLGMTRHDPRRPTRRRGSTARSTTWSRSRASCSVRRSVAPATFAEATTVALPGLGGVLPGVGRYDVLDWGLAFEIRDGKTPHWTGTRNGPGDLRALRRLRHVPVGRPRAGPGARRPDRPRRTGPWALDAWPPFSDTVIAAIDHRAA